LRDATLPEQQKFGLRPGAKVRVDSEGKAVINPETKLPETESPVPQADAPDIRPDLKSELSGLNTEIQGLQTERDRHHNDATAKERQWLTEATRRKKEYDAALNRGASGDPFEKKSLKEFEDEVKADDPEFAGGNY